MRCKNTLVADTRVFLFAGGGKGFVIAFDGGLTPCSGDQEADAAGSEIWMIIYA